MSIDEMRWILRPDLVCSTRGCQYATARQAMAAAQKVVTEQERTMSYPGIQALWCSRGHSFSELDPGRVIIPPASARDADGNEIDIPAQAICGEHAQNMNRRLTRPAEITPPAHYDPEYTAKLERDLGIDEHERA